MKSAGRTFVPSPDAFAALEESLGDEDAMKAALAAAGLSFAEWKSIGRRAWPAWHIAQGDFNSEAPLRDNEHQLADARARLASAERTLKAGVRDLSPEERSQRKKAAHDAAVNADDRAEMWTRKAEQLRDQIAAADLLGNSNLGGDPSASGQAARNEALSGVRAARSNLSAELAAAERNERQAREDARHFEQAAQHPESAQSDSERSDLMNEARKAADAAKADINSAQREGHLLQTRLSEQRRIDADTRKRSATESDIQLLRRHLAEFNDAWGLTIEGLVKAAPTQ